MKLYALLDGPPSIAVRMVFKALDIPYELVGVDYQRGEHLKGHYAQVKFYLIYIANRKFFSIIIFLGTNSSIFIEQKS